jgi:cobalamin transport system substrate-binding protein
VGRVAPLVAAALLAIGATGCGERAEPTGPTVNLYPLTLLNGDRRLIVTGPAERIAALDRPTASIVRALGAGGRIVAGPIGVRPDFAALRRARPDLIVAADTTDAQVLDRVATVTHARVYTAPGNSIRQVERAITQLGLLTGRPVQARALVHGIETRRALVTARLAGVRSVTVFVDTGFFTTVPDESLIGDLVRQAHATNVAGQAASGVPVEIAQLRHYDPDVYVALSDSGLTLADLRRDPRTRRLRAIRNGRFVILGAGLVQPGPQIGDGLVRLARLLHPDAFR